MNQNILNLQPDDVGISGRIKIIMCDAKKYPTYNDVKKAIENDDAEVSDWIQNLITTVGKTAWARAARGTGLKANEGQITYGAVGTGSTTPVVGNTTLDTELKRNMLSTSSYLDNKVTFRVFYNTSEANGVLTEFGWFGEDASAAVDSGTLFNHVTISKTKTAAKTLTIVQEITFA